MNYVSPRVRSWARLALAASLGGLLLPGCQTSSETPEAAGQRVGAAFCERYTRRNQLEYTRDTLLVAEIKAGKVTTQVQARDRYNELSVPIDKLTDSKRHSVFNDSLARSIATNVLLKEDRLEALRLMERYMEQCEADLTAWKKTLAPTNLGLLRRQLSGTIPEEAYDPASGMPPPPPPPPPLRDPIND